MSRILIYGTLEEPKVVATIEEDKIVFTRRVMGKDVSVLELSYTQIKGLAYFIENGELPSA